MGNFGVFHAERARRMALVNWREAATETEHGQYKRGRKRRRKKGDPSAVPPVPLDRWARAVALGGFHGGEPCYTARDESGDRICDVCFWSDIDEDYDLDLPAENSEDGEPFLVDASVYFPPGGEEREVQILTAASPDEWRALSPRDLYIARWEERRIEALARKACVEFAEQVPDLLGEEKHREMLEDPNPGNDWVRQAAAMRRSYRGWDARN
jgi:hypothetical protein